MLRRVGWSHLHQLHRPSLMQVHWLTLIRLPHSRLHDIAEQQSDPRPAGERTRRAGRAGVLGPAQPQ